MMNWLRGKLWKWQFDRTPTQRLGVLIVKKVQGNYYAVGTDKLLIDALVMLRGLSIDNLLSPQREAVIQLIARIETNEETR